MNFRNPRIIDSNGTKYKVGWDEYGWFTIGRVRSDPMVEDPDLSDYELADDAWTSFTPEGAEEVIEAIEEGL